MFQEDNLQQHRQHIINNLQSTPKNQQIFRGPRWQSYGSADRSNKVR